MFTEEDCNRLDFEILAEGGVCMYYQHDVLAEDLAWLAVESYEIVQFDEDAMESPAAFHAEARRKLGFTDAYESNSTAFSEQLERVHVPETGGVAIVFTSVQKLADQDPLLMHAVFDAISRTSRELLLTGRRFFALAQSDDPEFRTHPIGASEVAWNPRERAAWTRGL